MNDRAPCRASTRTDQVYEAAVAPLVRALSPALRWHFDEAGWNVLGYEQLDGRHADYTPGSTQHPDHR